MVAHGAEGLQGRVLVCTDTKPPAPTHPCGVGSASVSGVEGGDAAGFKRASLDLLF